MTEFPVRPLSAEGPFIQALETIPAEFATLTLTGMGPVLGCPRDATGEERSKAYAAVEKWRFEGGTLVLPWPVDVSESRNV